MKFAPLKAIFAAVLAPVLLMACHASERAAPERAFDYGGLSRSYRVYAPAVRSSRPGLLLVLHGWMGSGAEIEGRSNHGFDRLADRDGFVVAYPDAVAGQWHSGHPAETATADDVGFLSALIDSLSRTYGVDPSRIYVTGYSNGASMAYRLTCERPGRVAAVAPVSGGLAEGLMQACAQASRRPIPLLLIHGTADPEVPFDSGELEGNLAYWVRRNGCATTNPAITYLPNADAGDGTRTRVEHYTGCRNGADVILYAIEGGGDHWPNGDEPFRLESRGNVPRDFDAAGAIWSFLKAHRLQ